MPQRQEALIRESHMEGQGPHLGEEAKSKVGDVEGSELELPVLDFHAYICILYVSGCIYAGVGVDGLWMWTQVWT